MAHAAFPSMVSNRDEFDDDSEHRSAEHENCGTEQGGQKKSNEYL
jgi:hypothetical protein